MYLYERGRTTLEKNAKYTVEIINPRTGKIEKSEKVTANADGEWHFTSTNIASPLPTMEDWIMHLAKSS